MSVIVCVCMRIWIKREREKDVTRRTKVNPISREKKTATDFTHSRIRPLFHSNAAAAALRPCCTQIQL